jgi:hypothetical protein|tara:strand:- start:308 stop:481 length:174 start_codon:yes stop_codon:yes gene_type:complete
MIKNLRIKMEDTLKTTSAGLGGFWISLWNWLPEVVSLAVGLATLIYLIIKILKELRT